MIFLTKNLHQWASKKLTKLFHFRGHCLTKSWDINVRGVLPLASSWGSFVGGWHMGTILKRGNRVTSTCGWAWGMMVHNWHTQISQSHTPHSWVPASSLPSPYVQLGGPFIHHLGGWNMPSLKIKKKFIDNVESFKALKWLFLLTSPLLQGYYETHD